MSKKIKIKDLDKLNTENELVDALKDKGGAGKKIVKLIDYYDEMADLQKELVKLQNWVVKKGLRIAVIFEGRDTSGKSGTIRRFAEALNPRHARVVALSKPTEQESGQWYFQRYIKQLPNQGEVVFFDRSWYNRAVVEPVMGFCNDDQYEKFMKQVTTFERMLIDDGIVLIKFYFSIDKEEQKKRFADRQKSLVKRWKISPVDEQAAAKWDDYTRYTIKMFERTNDVGNQWVLINSNNKKKARVNAMKYVLQQFNYENRDKKRSYDLDETVIFQDYHSDLFAK